MPTPKLSSDQIKAAHDALAKHGGNQRAAAQALGIARSTFQQRLKQRPGSKGAAHAADVAKSKDASKKLGRSLADFRSEHDKDYIVPKKIRDALDQLGNSWEYESNFSRIAGVSLGDLGNYRDEFSDYIVVVSRAGKRAWAGRAELAKKMREMVS
jgi:hypothetical protein